MTDKVPLGRVTGDLDGARGPDVRSVITVPVDWLIRGGQLVVAVPRQAACEVCRGGGCETCCYRGAFTLTDDVRPQTVAVQLPSRGREEPSFVVRLPHQGPRCGVAKEEPGHWFLEVVPGARFSPGVSCQLPASDERLSAVWIVAIACFLAAITCWVVL